MSEITKYQPDGRRANIHGMVDVWGNETCKTRTGKRCTACCTFFRVEDPNLSKPAHATCEHQVTCRGCNIHKERPKACRPYHCSQSGPEIKFQLIGVALDQGETSREFAEEMVEKY